MSVIVLLPVFRPIFTHLRAQLESLSQQQHQDFICVVSYDGLVDDATSERVRYELPDERFEFTSTDSHRGTYRHFEQLISLNSHRRPFFALCDQDDVWLPDRLSIGLDHMRDPEVSLVSVNGQIVDNELQPIKRRTTFDWFGIAEKNVPFRFLLNQVTGASALCRTERFQQCVPFPNDRGPAVHDHWVYLAGSAAGRIIFDGRISWLYRQHAHNQIGASASRGFARRTLNGIGKAMSIVGTRVSGKNDLVLSQALEFFGAYRERWPNTLQVDDALPFEMSLRQRFQYLRPQVLMNSRLESLRLALSSAK